jgi:Cu/Ag efflux protein CusF
MKPTVLLATLAVLVAAPVASAAADKTPDSPKSNEPAKRHPLRGVVMGILPEKSALLVKHEEIPGVMRAMTMMFKVDAATLKNAKEGQAITGSLARESDGWWLRDVKPAATGK